MSGEVSKHEVFAAAVNAKMVASRFALKTLSAAYPSALLPMLGEFGCALKYVPAEDGYDGPEVEECWEVWEVGVGQSWAVGSGETPLLACVNALMTLMGYEDGETVADPELFDAGELLKAVNVTIEFLQSHLPGPEVES